MEFLTADELSELLRVSPNQIVVMARRGNIPAYHIDGRLRFDAREIEEWLKTQRSGNSSTNTPEGCEC
jgi:excisionase family DNA binding protein